jgi:hypothetical protein
MADALDIANEFVYRTELRDDCKLPPVVVDLKSDQKYEITFDPQDGDGTIKIRMQVDPIKRQVRLLE